MSTTDSCAVTHCLEPVSYVLEGETHPEDGPVFTTDRLYLCQRHRNASLQADPNLPIRAVEEVVAAWAP